jgi:hypothetical protein
MPKYVFPSKEKAQQNKTAQRFAFLTQAQIQDFSYESRETSGGSIRQSGPLYISFF